MPFRFRPVLEKMATAIARELQQGMYQQIGVDRGRFSPLKRETIRAKMKVSSATANLRMIRTKDFVTNAFVATAGDDFARVFVPDSPHGREVKSMARTAFRSAHNLAIGKKGYTKERYEKARRKWGEAAEKAPTYAELTQWQNRPERGKFFPTEEREVVENLASVQQGIADLQESFKEQVEGMIENLVVITNGD